MLITAFSTNEPEKKIQKHGYSFRNKVKLIRGGRDFLAYLTN